MQHISAAELRAVSGQTDSVLHLRTTTYTTFINGGVVVIPLYLLMRPTRLILV